MKEITDFRGAYRFLSNFSRSVVCWEDIEYASVEHAFQAAKTMDSCERELIKRAASPGIAKHLGRRVKLRDDWGEAKLSIMLTLVRSKFRDPTLKHKLLMTGDAELIEGNKWGDTYWGICRGKGRNMLGKILMQVRDELKELTEPTEPLTRLT